MHINIWLETNKVELFVVTSLSRINSHFALSMMEYRLYYFKYVESIFWETFRRQTATCPRRLQKGAKWMWALPRICKMRRQSLSTWCHYHNCDHARSSKTWRQPVSLKPANTEMHAHVICFDFVFEARNVREMTLLQNCHLILDVFRPHPLILVNGTLRHRSHSSNELSVTKHLCTRVFAHEISM